MHYIRDQQETAHPKWVRFNYESKGIRSQPRIARNCKKEIKLLVLSPEIEFYFVFLQIKKYELLSFLIRNV